MIIYCDSGGHISSVPSVVSFGETLRDITIITHQSSATVVLKIKPPNAEYLPDIICAPLLTKEKTVVYVAHLPKSVTTVSGRCLYQIEFVSPQEYINESGETVQDIKRWSSFEGSFNVARAVETNFPATEEELKDQSLGSLYAMLASVKMLYDEVVAVENTIGIGKELETTSKNLVDAMNEIYRGGTGASGVLPNVTEADNDKVLQVEDGKWKAKQINLATDNTLALSNGVLKVNLATNSARELPITAAEVDAKVGTIDVLLKTI